MLKIAIVIDDWKLPIFKKVLDRGCFTYIELAGITPDTITLSVMSETAEKLHPFVTEANNKAMREHDKGLH